MAVPVVILDLDGQVLDANQKARNRLQDDPELHPSLQARVSGGPNHPGWDMIPLRGTRHALGFFAIMQPTSRDAPSIEETALAWGLTERQGQVLSLVVQGLTNATIGEALGIGQGTVEFHISSIFDKAGVDNRATLLSKLLDLRLEWAAAAAGS